MKIEAIIREDKVNDVREALKQVGILGMNVFKIRGRQGGIVLSGRSGSYVVDMLSKMQLNIVLSEHNLDATIAAIVKSAKTGEEGEAGDGLIFVLPVEEVVRIRTGERGHDAVMYPGDIDERSGRGKAKRD